MSSECSTSSLRAGAPTANRSPLAILITTFLTLLLALAPSVVRAQDDSATFSLPPQAQEIVHAINRIREANGLNHLRAHTLLNQAAQNHVDDLIAHGMYGHYGSDGSNLRTRVARTGYPSLNVSENWVTSASVEGAMSWWMNDWIHRVNILDASWDEVGVGVGQVSNGYYIYVTDFSNTDGKDTQVIRPVQQTVIDAAAVVSSVPAGGLSYSVAPGDTLMAIGLRYGIEWQDIAVANNLGEFDILSIGQTLHIPGIASPAGTAPAAVEGRLYTVRAGDTLIAIASRHAISWESIASANRLGEYTILQIGMQIRLPGVPEEGASESTSNSAASNSAASTTATSATAPARLATNNSAGGTGGVSSAEGTPYTIRSGDTLITIATRNGMTWQVLARTNNLGENAVLQIGQTILLPTREAAPEFKANSGTSANGATVSGSAANSFVLPTPTPRVIITTEIIPVGTPVASGGSGTYTVKAGDTIIGIATRLGVSWGALLSVNGLTENSVLSLGQVLRVP